MKMSSTNSDWQRFCTLCDVKLMTEAVEATHYAEKKHKAKIKELTNSNPQEVQDVEDTPGIFLLEFILICSN